jgi:hypothetical protein
MSENNPEKQLPDFVMVHPKLEDDPVAKQGQVGFITAAVINTDDFYVGFDDGEVGLYSADALLAFKLSDQIYAALKRDVMQLSPITFKDLKSIALLLDHGSAVQHRKAMEIARNNPSVILNAMEHLDESLGLQRSSKIGR